MLLIKYKETDDYFKHVFYLVSVIALGVLQMPRTWNCNRPLGIRR
jgi:hypothetical protein